MPGGQSHTGTPPPWDVTGCEEHLMISFRFKHVCLESFGLNLPTTLLSSKEIEERIAPVY